MKASLRSAIGSLALASCLGAPDCSARSDDPVAAISPDVISLGSRGVLHLYVSQDWSVPDPGVARAVIVIHGLHRNADGYFRYIQAGKQASDRAGATTLIIAPQFLDRVDAEAHRLADSDLRWEGASWESGEPAIGPAPVSSFEILDAILTRLSDRKLYPNLREVVVAGHSGGGQLTQRFALASNADERLARAGMRIRYVVANPSSYAYFGPERPVPVSSCRDWDRWKYGLRDRPAYIASLSAPRLEHRYAARRVIYLLGSLDKDPKHPDLDTSCGGQAQGPERLSRGRFYVAILRSRNDGAPNHSLWEVPGVAHSADGMFNSPCGRAALFDSPGCAARDLPR